MAIGKKGTLLHGSLLDSGGDEDDPRTGLVNLADVMLVFACGLMIAIIGHYNVDLSSMSLEDAEPLEGELQEVDAGESLSSSEFSEVGVVYEDKETGDLYVVR